MPTPLQTITVASADLLAEFSHRIKKKIIGFNAKGLKDAAIIPAQGGILVDMPGMPTFVPAISGIFSQEVVFKTAAIESVAKVLAKYGDEFPEVVISLTDGKLRFQMGNAVFKLPVILPKI